MPNSGEKQCDQAGWLVARVCADEVASSAAATSPATDPPISRASRKVAPTVSTPTMNGIARPTYSLGPAIRNPSAST